MAEFNFTAINPKGKTISGEVSAKDLKDARASLRSQKLTVVKLTRKSGSEQKGSVNKSTASVDNKKSIIDNGKFRKGGTKGEKVGLEFLKRLHELLTSQRVQQTWQTGTQIGLQQR